MILFPAIDIKDGHCVRLLRGDMDRATIYNESPATQAKSFVETGFEWLHLVDLNGAIEGEPVNAESVRSILDTTDIKMQLGGGIRDLDRIDYWFDQGISRVILGTVAVKNPQLVTEACRKYPGQIVVSIDAHGDYVATDGWVKTSMTKVLDLALRMEDAGVAAIIYTDIHRDGALTGVNIDAITDLAFHLTVPVIASGGVSTLEDLKLLKDQEHAGIEGVISGRALYDGRIDPVAALKLVRDETGLTPQSTSG